MRRIPPRRRRRRRRRRRSLPAARLPPPRGPFELIASVAEIEQAPRGLEIPGYDFRGLQQKYQEGFVLPTIEVPRLLRGIDGDDDGRGRLRARRGATVQLAALCVGALHLGTHPRKDGRIVRLQGGVASLQSPAVPCPCETRSSARVHLRHPRTTRRGAVRATQAAVLDAIVPRVSQDTRTPAIHREQRLQRF